MCQFDHKVCKLVSFQGHTQADVWYQTHVKQAYDINSRYTIIQTLDSKLSFHGFLYITLMGYIQTVFVKNREVNILHSNLSI